MSILPPQKKWRKILFSLQYLMVIIIFVFLFRWAQGITLPQLKAPFVFLAILSVVIFRLTAIVRLRALFRNHFSFPRSQLITAQLFSSGVGLFTPAKLGESIKIMMISKETAVRKKMIVLFMLEKMLDSVVFLPLFLVYIVSHHFYVSLLLLLLGLGGIVILSLYSRLKKFAGLQQQLLRFPPVLITLVMYALQILSFWFVVLAGGEPVSFWETAIIWSVAAVVTAISALPGGLGARELSLAYLLSSVGSIDKAAATNLAVLYTLLNYSATWLLILGSMLWFRKRIIDTNKENMTTEDQALGKLAP